MQPSIEHFSVEVRESPRFFEPTAYEPAAVDVGRTGNDTGNDTGNAAQPTVDPFIDVNLSDAERNVFPDDGQYAADVAPPKRERRKRMTFFTNATAHTRNLQKSISSQASSLRTKVRRGLNTVNSYGQRASAAYPKASMKSVPRSLQPSPKERKKFKDIGFANKLRAIHMPKMPKAELAKFTDRFRKAQSTRRPSATATTISALEKCGESDMDTIAVDQSERAEPAEAKSATLGRIDYPKMFTRFKARPKAADEPAAGPVDGSDYDASVHRPSFASFSSHFATVPRTASRIKKSIKSKLSKTYNKSTARNGSGSKLN